MERFKFPEKDQLELICKECREFVDDGTCTAAPACPSMVGRYTYCQASDTEYQIKGRIRKADSSYRQAERILNKSLDKGLFAGAFTLPAFSDEVSYVFSKDHGMMFSMPASRDCNPDKKGFLMNAAAFAVNAMTTPVSESDTEQFRKRAAELGITPDLPFSVSDDGLYVLCKGEKHVIEVRAWGHLSRIYPEEVAIAIQSMMGRELSRGLNLLLGGIDDSQK